MDKLSLYEPSYGYASNCDEAIFAQDVPGIFAQFGESCLRLVESKESSPVDEEEIKIKMDNGVNSLASEGTDLFIDLWERKPCHWDPE